MEDETMANANEMSAKRARVKAERARASPI